MEKIIKKRNKPATYTYEVVEKITYVDHFDELKTLEPGNFFVGTYKWTEKTGMQPYKLVRFIKLGKIKKHKTIEFCEKL
jgi:hypothetical protein